jgi:signal transduction histidine kinase
MGMKAKMLAHPHKPELTQPETLIEATDVDGKAFFVDFIKAAKKGRGWTQYMWPVPGMDCLDLNPIFQFLERHYLMKNR